jgi:hypothetical protein
VIMATYKAIQARVKSAKGFVPKTCWIAHVKSLNGLTDRVAPNRLSTNERAYPCPPEKGEAIEAAFRHFGMI